MPVPPPATPFICTSPPPLVLTPAARLNRFVRFRRFTGSSRTSCDPSVSACRDAAFSMSGASPATRTVSSTVPTSSVNVCRTDCPAPSVIPSLVYVLKPASPMVTEYDPVDRAVSTNSPRSSVMVSRATPVPRLVATTVAPGTTAPELSRTAPRSVAVVTCACGVAMAHSSTHATTTIRRD